jgi:ArsR family transcriptional regulator
MARRPEVVRLLKALADGTRLRVVNLLRQGEICGCDIGRVLQLAQPNIAQHLAYLRHTGLVSSRREGYRVYYQIVEKRDRVFSGLLESLRLAFDREPVFRGDTRRLKEAILVGVCAGQCARSSSREPRISSRLPSSGSGSPEHPATLSWNG